MTARIASVVIILIAVIANTGDDAGAQGFGFGGPGFGQGEMQIVSQFDRDGDGRLNTVERTLARQSLRGVNNLRGGGAGVTPGQRLTPSDVRSYPNSVRIYDDTALRTFFLQFESDDWEQELTTFFNTDVEVPATLIVDGRTYRDVGVHFRGNSSFRQVPVGYKHSLNLTIDYVNDKQDVGSYNSFNLLNANGDPTFLRTMLYGAIARNYIPIAKTNYVRVVINGESWGVYVSSQQVDKDFLEEHYKTRDGARWRVPGSPRGRGGLEYLGDTAASYRRVYEIKSDDNPQDWAALINLTKVLNQTPVDKLEAALAPILDIDGALRFLALDVALVNSDGYWTRASDYNIYLDPNGRFHVIPHDFNEAMQFGGRGGFGPGGGGPTLDPLVALNDPSKPLRSKLLQVPALREKYLGYVKDIAEKHLDWAVVEPIARRYQALITADVKVDTRKLYSFEEFQSGLASVRSFVDRRRAYLLGDVIR
jgi:hypothetical protein